MATPKKTETTAKAAPTITEKTETTAKAAPTITEKVKIEIPMPTRSRGATSLYDFDSMEVGDCIGVKNRTKKEMASTISNANRKNRVQAKDENGNLKFRTKDVKDAEGNVTKMPDTSAPVWEFTKHFAAVEVTDEVKAAIKGTPLEGSSVILTRDK